MALEQNNSSSGDDALFFKIYRAFLEVDSINSFTQGRNRHLIKDFYHLYYAMAMAKKPKEQEVQTRLKKAKKDLKIRFEDYIYKNGKHRPKIWADDKTHSTYLHIIENPAISEAFLHFTDATEQYARWRDKLSNENILAIYMKNLEDRHKYYTDMSLLQFPNIQANTLKNNKILKQTLIEFHNAISHLVAIYYGREQENNKNRAINHFKRGALDSYKAIIKDFYHLYNINRTTYEPPLETLKDIRKKEYLGIGSDERLFKEYREFTQKLIDSI